MGDSLFKDKVDRDFAVTIPAHLFTSVVDPDPYGMFYGLPDLDPDLSINKQ